MNRQHFLGLAGRWAGALALSPLAISHRGTRQPPRAGGTVLAMRVEQFLSRFDQEPPFSFTYGGRPSLTLLARWPRTRQSVPLDPVRLDPVRTASTRPSAPAGPPPTRTACRAITTP